MRTLFVMGLLSFILGSKSGTNAADLTRPIDVDLGFFKCGRTVLGERPAADEPFSGHFDSSGVGNFEKSGIELGTKNGVLDYAFITLTNFKGNFLKSGERIQISTQTTPEEILSYLSAPYWKATDDDETILFYEFQQGKIELQFEFPNKHNLGFLTLSRDGVLSKPDQRKAYGVTKEWPPK
jgi:hypothetical protein